jgi:hypothetical protein
MSKAAMPSSDGNSLILWFKKYSGTIHDALELHHTEEHGYQFLARRNINAGERLFKCPVDLTLSWRNVADKPLADIKDLTPKSICTHLIDHVKKDTVAAFLLAEQRQKGEHSFWASYIRLLPREEDMSTPLWFSPEELQYLKGTNLFSKNADLMTSAVGQRMAMYRAQYDQGIAVLEKAGATGVIISW